MKNQRLIGWLLLILAFLVLLGMLLKIDIYWFVVDIIVIIVCLTCGIMLLYKKKHAE
jgi:L-asparagine transporter-like permease